MWIEAIVTIVLGGLLFRVGMRLGRVMLRRGATAHNLFKGNLWSLVFLGLYVALLVLALNVPQMQVLPLEWRIYGMQVTWTIMRVMLLGFCGLAWVISWHTARSQVVAVVLLGVLGIGGFSTAQSYFLAPIHSELQNNLQPNGVFRQTSMSSCAPAALATVLRRWGLEATESETARLAGTSRLGTSMPQLILAARRLGMDGVELAPTWEQMQQINRPGVLGVWLIDGLRRLPHAVALLAIDQNWIAIGDPARGRIYRLNHEQFAQIWRQQYVPIFRPGDATLTPQQIDQSLQKLGFLAKAEAPFWVTQNDRDRAVQRFRQAMGLEASHQVDVEMALLLTGPFLQNAPNLKPEDQRLVP